MERRCNPYDVTGSLIAADFNMGYGALAYGGIEEFGQCFLR
ncbi:hypothetical protein PT7_1844 [Pusillimonas sp. T7-7]|nr:hypothetical protein PT7_1844 [Pusillimonas sp. T7-7]